MSFVYLIGGIGIGFLMAVPIGAVGILCIRRTLQAGRRQGYITGLAGATADLAFSTVSAFSIRLISDFITIHQYVIRLVGGVILLLMGVLLIRSRRSPGVNGVNALEETGIYFSPLIIALTNPLVMFGYAAVMASVGTARLFDDFLSLSLIVVGVFFGSLLWFFMISNLVLRFRSKVTENRLALVNRIAGVLLILIGLSTIWGGAHGIR